jgi:formylglycine-generating enzyme required for sulfatase activity
MVVVAAGDFDMGSPDSERGRLSSEGPRHRVSFAKPFAVGRYAITRDEFNAFVTASAYQFGRGCHAELDDKWVDVPTASFLTPPGFAQDGRHPAVCVSWKDANEYVKWLSAQTKRSYRLLTEAEREYITRAGTATPYWWGEAVKPEIANYDKRMRQVVAKKARQTVGEPIEAFGQTVPVDHFPPNAWGLYQVHGNVAEWVQDCWNANYFGAPTDGSAAEVGDCSRRVLRGGGWNHWPEDIRAAYREAVAADHRYYEVGFRVARNLCD